MGLSRYLIFYSEVFIFSVCVLNRGLRAGDARVARTGALWRGKVKVGEDPRGSSGTVNLATQRRLQERLPCKWTRAGWAVRSLQDPAESATGPAESATGPAPGRAQATRRSDTRTFQPFLHLDLGLPGSIV
jgi:hypothetical protein